MIYASDLDASNNLNRKSNIKITSKLTAPKMDVDDDDAMMMNMVIPAETKPVKSKTDDQENKPGFTELNNFYKNLKTKKSYTFSSSEASCS